MASTYKKLPPAVKIYAPVSYYFSIATIFRPSSRGAKRVPFEYPHDTDTYFLKITGMETLDAFDLDVLLGVLHIAGKDIKDINGSDPDVLALQATGAVRPDHFNTRFAEFTRYELLNVIGRVDSAPNYEAVKASLIRLSKVHFQLDYKKTKQWMASSLLSVTGLDGNCKVVFNCELGRSLVEDYSRIWFDERAGLTECGKILHTFLSGSIREGTHAGLKSLSRKVDTLVEHVYGEPVKGMERKKLSKRRSNVYAEAAKIAAMWPGSELSVCSENIGDACFTFLRPTR